VDGFAVRSRICSESQFRLCAVRHPHEGFTDGLSFVGLCVAANRRAWIYQRAGIASLDESLFVG
jgi:hypothetical protein